MAFCGIGFAADCPFRCLGCRVSLEMSSYGAMWIRMGGFEVMGGIREVVDDHKRPRHFATSFLVPYIQQSPWAVIYVGNRVPRGTLGGRETVNYEL
jgi:hypothetical protein